VSRLNKALERIKTRESSNPNALRSGSGFKTAGTTNINDPLGKQIHKVRLNDSVMHTNHLITKQVDPAVRTSYKMLRTRILHAMHANGWRSLAITSASQGDGKTVTAINLAISLAGDVNHNVCLVDLDLRHSSIARYLDLSAKYGVSDCLIDNLPVEKALIRPHIDRLFILPNIRHVMNSSELLSSPAMHELSALLSADPNRIIIYDMPPILAADDMLAFNKNTDAILFVVAEGVTRRTDTVRARELMDELNVIGTVLNQSDEKTATYY